jgi:predicted dienelactone hydrolase
MLRRLLLLAVAATALGAAPPAPSYAVASLLATWHDDARDRDIPVKIYYPEDGAAPTPGRFPVIVFSHGLGGTREGYAYLGQAWAAHGYVSVHVQHLGSDDGAYKGTLRPLKKMRAAIADPANSLNRPLDIRYAIDRLFALEDDPSFPLSGHLDLAHIGVAGHSFGAYTAMAIAGQTYAPDGGEGVSRPDPRVTAVVAMSTPTPARILQAGSFDAVAVPVFHMTGTRDEVKVLGQGSDTAINRRIPYDRTTQAPAYLLTFAGGDHLVFSGRLIPREHDREFQHLVVEGTEAFWDAYLKGDRAARGFLQGGGFAREVVALGVFEEKNLPAHD